MNDKILKAADIAVICGVPEKEVKKISKDFSALVPSRELGRVKLYEEKAAGIIKEISDLSKTGFSREDILKSLGSKPSSKSTKEKVSGKIRKNPSLKKTGETTAQKNMSGKDEKQPAGRKSPASLTGNKKEKSESDIYGALDYKISKLSGKIEKIENEIAENHKKTEKDIEDLRCTISQLSEKLSVTSEWTDYFEKTLDEYRQSQDALRKDLSEWTEYTQTELEYLRLPVWKRKNKRTEK
ncbi:DNA-binding transcriptional MerR regulator [Methanomicrobium sp. W14]|uniref:hypothetical protein n=1 Tax=Methanomicrobium sp. W14 TaxID=2817839 RepID=UPI001AE6BB67|nr:hypothetical protein [Methanomicrobium sp. W14]MBP2133416.1 DNA-binding transcriptional MerR regulator [Methanomicrobium sp. W14]